MNNRCLSSGHRGVRLGTNAIVAVTPAEVVQDSYAVGCFGMSGLVSRRNFRDMFEFLGEARVVGWRFLL